MAVIRPFRGIRYNEAKVGNLDSVVTPPYDVISPDDQQLYYDRHPNNVVRLILPREDAPAKYEFAAAHLNDWLRTEVLSRDEDPAIYACVQEYEIRGQRKRRLGFTCLVRLENFGQGSVLPHENILSKPLEDRLSMIRATRSNFDSVFGLYADGRTEGILAPFIARKPDATAVDRDGVRCDLYRVSDPNAIEAIAQTLADEAIVIADGHHRYTAALAYRNEMREKTGRSDPDAPYEYVMMTLVSLEDPGLIVLPTHRVVGNLEGFDRAAFLAKAGELFDLRETPANGLEAAVESLAAQNYVYGLYLGDGIAYVMQLKPDARPEALIESAGSDALKRLDVSVLHALVLDRLLGISAQQLSAQSNLTYSRDPGVAMRSVDEGRNQLFFLMNPTKVEEVKAVAAEGDRMPQKSTFFYPKLLTGIIMRAWS